jgi:hypothetical protein
VVSAGGGGANVSTNVETREEHSTRRRAGGGGGAAAKRMMVRVKGEGGGGHIEENTQQVCTSCGRGNPRWLTTWFRRRGAPQAGYAPRVPPPSRSWRTWPAPTEQSHSPRPPAGTAAAHPAVHRANNRHIRQTCKRAQQRHQHGGGASGTAASECHNTRQHLGSTPAHMHPCSAQLRSRRTSGSKPSREELNVMKALMYSSTAWVADRPRALDRVRVLGNGGHSHPHTHARVKTSPGERGTHPPTHPRARENKAAVPRGSTSG